MDFQGLTSKLQTAVYQEKRVVAIRIEQVAYTYCVTRGTIYNTCIGSTNRDKQMKYEEFKSLMNRLYDIHHSLRSEGKGKLLHTAITIDEAIYALSGNHPRLWNKYCDDISDLLEQEVD